MNANRPSDTRAVRPPFEALKRLQAELTERYGPGKVTTFGLDRHSLPVYVAIVDQVVRRNEDGSAATIDKQLKPVSHHTLVQLLCRECRSELVHRSRLPFGRLHCPTCDVSRDVSQKAGSTVSRTTFVLKEEFCDRLGLDDDRCDARRERVA